MNTTKLLKNFDVKNLEKTLANLININNTEIDIGYSAFDEHHNIYNIERYVVNPYKYRMLSDKEKKCSSVNKVVNKILTAHPNAYLNNVEFSLYTERVIVSFYEHI